MTDFQTDFYSNVAPININPFRAMAQAEQVRALTEDRRAQAEQRQQQTAALRRKAQQDAALDSMMQGAFVEDPNTGVSTFDRPTFERALVQGGQGHLYPAMAETLDKLDQSAAAFRKQQNTLYARTILAVQDHGNTPDAVTNAIAYLLKNGAMTKEHAQPILDAAAQDPSPEAIGALMTKLGGGLPEYAELTQTEQKRKADLAKTEAETQKANEMVLSPGQVAFNRSTNEQIASAPEKTKPVFRVSADKRTLEPVGDVPAGAQVLQEAQPLRVSINAGKNALDEGGIEYAATLFRLTNQMPSLGMGGKEEKASIINGAAAQAKALGQTPAAAIQRTALYKADAGSLNKITLLGTTAQAAEYKAIGQIGIISELSQKVDRTRFPLINKAILTGQVEIAGDKDASLLLNAITTFGSEYGKIIEGSTGSVSGSSESARNAATRLIQAKMSKGTLQGALDLMHREMDLTIQGYDVTRTEITKRMGGTPQSLTNTGKVDPLGIR